MYQKNSADNDQGINTLTIFFHGNSSLLDCKHISQQGLSVREGRPTISADFAHALDWAEGKKHQYSKSPTAREKNERGVVFVLRQPKGLNIGYGLFTTMYVYPSTHEIKGAPVKYASARKQLAFYTTSDTEKRRKELEELVSHGKELPRLRTSPEDILMIIHPTTELKNTLTALQKNVKAFHMPHYSDAVDTITTLIRSDPRNIISPEVVLEDVVNKMVATTIESIALSRLRNIQLDVKSVCGYQIYREDSKTKNVDSDKTKTYVQSLYNRTHTDTFRLGDPWLSKYLRVCSEELLAELIAQKKYKNLA